MIFPAGYEHIHTHMSLKVGSRSMQCAGMRDLIVSTIAHGKAGDARACSKRGSAKRKERYDAAAFSVASLVASSPLDSDIGGLVVIY